MTETQTETALSVDVIIFGGGVAGLWLLNRLRQQGYQTVLLESVALGAGQTRYAQGIIHGGTKYALTGKLTASSEAVRDMPGIWQQCLAGEGEIDLRKVRVLSDHQYLWSTTNLTSRITGFFASKIMHGRTGSVDADERPELFRNPAFHGRIYRLEEQILDTRSVVMALAEPCKQAIFKSEGSESLHKTAEGIFELSLSPADPVGLKIKARKLILTGGAGNEDLLHQLGLTKPAMQRRPLKMVMLRGNLPEMLYAHCMGAGVNPRITISSHRDRNNDIVWYLGGQLAEEGVKRTDADQIRQAASELAELMPWLDLKSAQWAVLDIDRAEPDQAGGKRPDTSFAMTEDNVVIAWPTKLALAPKLAGDVLQILAESDFQPSGVSDLPAWTHPDYADLPWQEEERWG